MFEMMALVIITGVVLIAAMAIVAAVAFATNADKRISDERRRSKSWVDKEEGS